MQSIGANLAQTPSRVVQMADTLILVLIDDKAVRQVILSSETASTLQNRTVIQMGIISLNESRAI